MKHFFAGLIALVTLPCLYSCGKKAISNSEQLTATTAADGRIEDQDSYVHVVKHNESSPIRGYHNDLALDTTKAVGDTAKMRYGSILFVGNSLFRNFKDDTAWRYMARSWDVIDRGVSGSMWSDLYRNRDSLIYDYKPRQIILYHIENEVSYRINTGYPATDQLMIDNIIFEFNRLYDDIRLRLPKTKITILTSNHNPFHVGRGMTASIDSVNRYYLRKAISDSLAGNKASFVDCYGINDDPAYYKDGIHFKIPSNAYGRWAAALKPHFIKRVKNDTVASPIILPNPDGPTVRIFGDYQPYSDTASITVKGYLYLRLNAGYSSAISPAWITSMKWTQLSGPTTVTYEKPNSGNTIVYGLAKGTYVFQVAVTDSKGNTNYGKCTATFK